MKILAYSVSQDNADTISDGALLLMGRSGYDSKLFVPNKQKKKYMKAVADANWHWYLALSPEMVMAGFDPMHYAQDAYDLMLEIPDDIKLNPLDMDNIIPAFCRMVGKARLSFSKNPKKMEYKLPRGVVMRRVNHE